MDRMAKTKVKGLINRRNIVRRATGSLLRRVRGKSKASSRLEDQPRDFSTVDHTTPASEDDHYDLLNITTFETSRSALRRRLTQGAVPNGAMATQKIMSNCRFMSRPVAQSAKSRDELVASRQPILPSGKSSSTILRTLSVDTLLCIVDHLWYPDAFALAMTCKTIHGLVPLAPKKQVYARRLGELGTEDPHVDCRRLFCAVCLYSLDEKCYFKANSRSGEYQSQTEHGLRICQQCEEFRTRKARMLAGNEDSEAFPIWRRSTREVIPGYGGLLWYRCRI